MTLISADTVFILGAGASFPYGFPLGPQLRLEALKNYQDRTGNAVHLYNTTPFSFDDVKRFTGALSLSGLLSVDAFLERRPEFLEIGKAVMAIELLTKEQRSSLWYAQDNWMTYLYQAMVGSSLDDFAKNKASFITFNYDRTVEHFLFTSLQNSFGSTTEDVAQVFRAVHVVHLHGKLGDLEWQGGQKVVPYGTQQIDAKVMEMMCNQIKVVHEDITDGRDKDFDLAKSLLSSAKRVYLLGFGFGARNVQRLDLANLRDKDAFNGTCYGMTPKESADCRLLCGGRIGLSNHSSLDFLRNIAQLN